MKIHPSTATAYAWIEFDAEEEAEIAAISREIAYWREQASVHMMAEVARQERRARAAEAALAELRAQIPFLLSVIACGESLSAEEIQHLRALAAGPQPAEGASVPPDAPQRAVRGETLQGGNIGQDGAHLA